MTTKFKVIFEVIKKDGTELNPVQKGTAEIFFGGGVVDCYNKAGQHKAFYGIFSRRRMLRITF